MKRLILISIICIVSGCANQTAQNEMNALLGMTLGAAGALDNIGQTDHDRMYDAQYNYYTRPYEVGGITYFPQNDR